MVFQENDFSQELQNSEIMQGQIKEAIKDVQPDVDNCFLDCLKGLNNEQLIKIIEKNYKNPDGSWKKRGEMRPKITTGHAYTTIVQCALKMLGYYSGEINAFYSSDVIAAVRLFQEENCFNDDKHVKVDGVVGPNTFSLIVAKLGGIAPSSPTQEVAKSPTEQGKTENKPEQAVTEEQKAETQTSVLSLQNMIDKGYMDKDDSLFSKAFWIFNESGKNDTKCAEKCVTLLKDCTDPKIYAFIFYKSFKGRGTDEKTFDTAFTYAKNNKQLSGAIKEFDTLGGNGFIHWMCEEFNGNPSNRKLARKYITQIAESDTQMVKNFLLKRNQNTVTEPLRRENPELVQTLGLEWNNNGGWHEAPVVA